MGNEVILCSSCGITLRPFMRLCPRCGAVRENPRPIASPAPEESTRSASLPSNFLKVASGATGATGATGAKEATKATWAKESTGSTTSTELKSARENSIETNGEQKTEVI